MAWFYLVLAGLSEVAWAVGLKKTEGFRNLPWSAYTITFMIVSFYLLALALRSLPVGTAYAVWTGIGALGVALIGILFLGESADLGRIASIGLIVAGVAGLKFFSVH